ncbi:hypothetical protein SLEP1_g59096, partial [Rubroshorea leprosula]
MSNNSLSGQIPNSLASLRALKFLKLSMNNLSGELSPALQNCTVMETLDLGENKFSGNVPAWIGEKMPSLLVLSLRSNLFTGYIPTQLCDLSSLHILDLAENNLSGPVPNCIGNLSGMNSIITSMRYEGQLWVVAKGRDMFYDQILYLVNSIDLARKIPASIGSLQGLETLDLSRNQLSGTIPPSMASITALNHLNLSHNHLSGPIPTTNQFQTFIDPSIYEDNVGLCGPPLPTECSTDDESSLHLPGGGKTKKGEANDNQKLGFYVSLALGFVVGFWGVCGTL